MLKTIGVFTNSHFISSDANYGKGWETWKWSRQSWKPKPDHPPPTGACFLHQPDLITQSPINIEKS